MKFLKKPVVIEAWQLPVPDADTHGWGDDPNIIFKRVDRMVVEAIISTLEGTMTANGRDWIIRGVKGELYPCKPDIFAATYEPVDSAPALDQTVFQLGEEEAYQEVRQLIDFPPAPTAALKELMRSEPPWSPPAPDGVAIENAARAMYERGHEPRSSALTKIAAMPWETIGEQFREYWRDCAKIGLEAALSSSPPARPAPDKRQAAWEAALIEAVRPVSGTLYEHRTCQLRLQFPDEASAKAFRDALALAAEAEKDRDGNG